MKVSHTLGLAKDPEARADSHCLHTILILVILKLFPKQMKNNNLQWSNKETGSNDKKYFSYNGYSDFDSYKYRLLVLYPFWEKQDNRIT